MLTSIALTAALIGAGLDVAVAQTYPSRAPESTLEPSLTQILATQATQAALSPVSNVQGVGFNRIVQIWLENTVSAEKAIPRSKLNVLTDVTIAGLHIGRRRPQLAVSVKPRHSFDQFLRSNTSFGTQLLRRGLW